MNYPKEDKCRHCGQHLGWMLDPIGEMLGLGLCNKPECKEKEEHINNESNKGKRN